MKKEHNIMCTIGIVLLLVLLFFCVSKWWLFATIPITIAYFIFKYEFQTYKYKVIFSAIVAAVLISILLPIPIWAWFIVLVAGVFITDYLGEHEPQEPNGWNYSSVDSSEHIDYEQTSHNTITTRQQQYAQPQQRKQQHVPYPNNKFNPRQRNRNTRNYNQTINNYQGYYPSQQTGNNNNESFYNMAKKEILKKIDDKLNEEVNDFIDSRFNNDEDYYDNNQRNYDSYENYDNDADYNSGYESNYDSGYHGYSTQSQQSYNRYQKPHSSDSEYYDNSNSYSNSDSYSNDNSYFNSGGYSDSSYDDSGYTSSSSNSYGGGYDDYDD